MGTWVSLMVTQVTPMVNKVSRMVTSISFIKTLAFFMVISTPLIITLFPYGQLSFFTNKFNFPATVFKDSKHNLSFSEI